MTYGFDAKNFVSRVGQTELLRQPNFRELKVGSLARLSFEKDLGTLIRGFTLFHNSISPRSTLEIYGEGPELESLKELIITLKMQDSVFLMGKTSNPAEVLSEFDVFVLASKFEGFGMALLEAMAVECKIIAARNTAIVEVVGTEGAGIFFETSNELDLVEKMMNSLNGDDIQFKIQQNKQIEHFTVANMGNKIDTIYKSVI